MNIEEIRKQYLTEVDGSSYLDYTGVKSEQYIQWLEQELVKISTMHSVSHRTFKPNCIEVEDMAEQIDKFIEMYALAKPATYSKKLRTFLADKLNEYGC